MFSLRRLLLTIAFGLASHLLQSDHIHTNWYSLYNSTRISNCTENSSTNSLHRSTGDLSVCVLSSPAPSHTHELQSHWQQPRRNLSDFTTDHGFSKTSEKALTLVASIADDTATSPLPRIAQLDTNLKLHREAQLYFSSVDAPQLGSAPIIASVTSTPDNCFRSDDCS